MKILTTLILLLSVKALIACSCKGDRTVKSSYNSADIVLVGTVQEAEFVSIHDILGTTNEQPSWRNSRDSINYFTPLLIRVKLKIESTYKDKFPSDEIIILTPSLSASCGFTRFKEDQQFIVYGFKEFILTSLFPKEAQSHFEEKNFLWTHHCARTTEYTSADEAALKTLDKE